MGWRSLEHEVRARGHGRQGTEKRTGSVTERNRLNVISVEGGLLVGNGTCLAKNNRSLQERVRCAKQFKGNIYILLLSCVYNTVSNIVAKYLKVYCFKP